jgi:hypothetical protein
MAALVELTSILETAFLHHATRGRIFSEIIRPYIAEMLLIQAIVEQKAQGLVC